MYTFAPKLKLVAIIAMVLGIILFGVGYFINTSNGIEYVQEQIAENPEAFNAVHVDVSVAQAINTDHDNGEVSEIHSENEGAHMDPHSEHLLHKYHNKPWSALLIASILFTGVAAAAMFFLAIQHVAQAGWVVIVTRVMEAITAFIPVGGVLLLIVLIASAMHANHLYHWMDLDLRDFESENFDKFLKTKEPWLNTPFWLVRSVLYLLLWTFAAWMLRKKSKFLDENPSFANYQSLYKWGVIAIIIYALTSMASGWDWIMSLDPHWYSTLFGWYVMVSCLVTAIAIITLISIHLKKGGFLPVFNDNHLHDLTKYLFGFSLLWGYLWLCQFELIWYANIPEESVYFLQRDVQYDWSYYNMLIINVVIPFLALISSSIKRNYTVVTVLAFVVIAGHWWDIFNQVMPGTVGPWGMFGLLEFGALFLVGGLFVFVVMNALTKLKLEPKGNPLYHESKVYEYPF